MREDRLSRMDFADFVCNTMHISPEIRRRSKIF